MLDVRDLEVAYGDARALSGVTLSVGPGKSVALLGPNGAGKSTLLGSIAGLHRPRAGAHLLVFGVLFIAIARLLPGGLVQAAERVRRLLAR